LNSCIRWRRRWSRKNVHIDLNDQEFGRFDQDFRLDRPSKTRVFLVKLLEDYGYNGCRHFDAHAYRQSDYEDVKILPAVHAHV